MDLRRRINLAGEGSDNGTTDRLGGGERPLNAVPIDVQVCDRPQPAGADAAHANAMIEQAGLRIVAQKRVRITRDQAETFYAVHRERPFFGELVDFMVSGPVVVQVLEGDSAIVRYRDIMGATDPAKAAAGTIRKVHAKSIGENSVHGSDAPDTAVKEIAQFFSGNEIVG